MGKMVVYDVSVTCRNAVNVSVPADVTYDDEDLIQYIHTVLKKRYGDSLEDFEVFDPIDP